jgi:hypothetical protein
MYVILYGTVLNISMNGTQARTVSLFFLCVCCVGCLRSAAAACPHALLRGDPPNLVPPALGEPDVARVNRPGRDAHRNALGRGDGELGDGVRFGPGGSTAQAQQADTGDQGREQCDQARPPSRTIHASSSFVSDGKRPTGNEPFQDRSVDRDTELL